jgi:ferric-dicitrate binding protein FerR (iron transport regulator)
MVSDASLAQLRVNGAFLAGEQDAFVAALQEYFPISVERDGDGNIRLLPRR